MNVFISEYVCGGGWPEANAPPSLMQEGRAMLQAIVNDFSQVPNCRVVTTWDADQPPLMMAAVDVVTVSGDEEESRVFARLAAASDVCMVIAPELGNLLAVRCQLARRAGARQLLNPVDDVVELCSDKLRLYEFLVRHEISTIPTVNWNVGATGDFDWLPVVIKPRFGAGSQDIRVHESVDAARQKSPPLFTGGRNPIDELIAQPFVTGTAVSVGVLCDPSGSLEILPVATQRLSTDGHFRYLGGQIPWEGTAVQAIRTVVTRTCQALAGLSGYIGFDLIVPLSQSAAPVVVEINPRLTTSYLGYRQLTKDNLADRLLRLEASVSPIRWEPGAVAFTPNGHVERSVDKTSPYGESPIASGDRK